MIDTDKDIKDAFMGSYADDTKMWRAVTSLADQERLQQQLDIFYDWAQSNNKHFKCKILINTDNCIENECRQKVLAKYKIL